jgi:CheY-like chemotaxis protein
MATSQINKNKEIPRKRVLIVDDDPVFVRLLETDLHVAGYEAFSAKDGYMGVEKANKEQPDLIIMDIMMPGMDGHRTSEIIKNSDQTADIPIVYVTAKDGLLDEELAMELGAEFFLKKPYEPDILLSVIQKTLQTKEEDGS